MHILQVLQALAVFTFMVTFSFTLSIMVGGEFTGNKAPQVSLNTPKVSTGELSSLCSLLMIQVW